jgi:ribosomal subunit interface protein
MDINIAGRHIAINDELKEQLSAQLEEAVEKLKSPVISAEVEFASNEAKASSAAPIRCEITLFGKGPVIRAGGAADDKVAAFEIALEKLKSQLRKAADRRKARRGLRVQDLAFVEEASTTLSVDGEKAPKSETRKIAGLEVEGDGPLVVREKQFSSAPLSLAQALDEMELVGHDFFLYVDAETALPSVVYRRKAYNYGVLHLSVA